MRIREPGATSALCSARIEAKVDLPDCREQLRSMRGASEPSSSACHGSGTIPKEWTNSSRSAGTEALAAPRRAFRRSISALSRAALAVTTLELFHFASEVLEVRPLPYLGSPEQGVVALKRYGTLAFLHASIKHASDYVAYIPLDLGELPSTLRLPAPPCPPAPLLGVRRVM